MLKRKSKRVLSIVLAVAMIVGLFPIAAFADEGDVTSATINEAKVGETEYATLEEAVTAVASATEKTITLINDVTLKSQVTLPEGVTLNGGNHTISAVAPGEGTNWASDGSNKYMILVSAKNVTIKEVTMDANHNAYGCIQFFKTTDGKVENVTLKNAQNLGLMVNASQVTATGTITLDGNGWGDVINVGWGNNISGVNSCSLDVSKANLVGVDSIYADAGDVERANSATSSSGDDKTPITINTPDGLVPVSSGDAGIAYAPADSPVIVATVNDAEGKPVRYSNLQAAITAAKDSGTVTLVNDVNLTDGVEVEGTVTLDLNGFKISDSVGWNPGENVDYLLAVKRGGNLTINDNSANKTGAITTENDKIAVAVKLTIKGEDGEGDAATLTVNGGTLKAPFYGISGNGTRHKTELTINGGTIKGTKGTGIYQPQDGTVTINGGTITGLTGIEIRSGQLDVNGGTFISTAEKYEEAENGGGTTVTGAAIAVSQHTTDKIITVTVDGGTLEGPKSFVETGVQKPPVKGSSATINNGTFVGEVSSDDLVNIVKGGQFSAPVLTNLLDDTLTAQL